MKLLTTVIPILSIVFMTSSTVILSAFNSDYNDQFHFIDYLLTFVFFYLPFFITGISSFVRFKRWLYHVCAVFFLLLVLVALFAVIFGVNDFLWTPNIIISVLWLFLYYHICLRKNRAGAPVYSSFKKVLTVILVTIFILVCPFIYFECYTHLNLDKQFREILSKKHIGLTEKRILSNGFQLLSYREISDPNWHYYGKTDTLYIINNKVPFKINFIFANGQGFDYPHHPLLPRSKKNLYLPISVEFLYEAEYDSLINKHLNDTSSHDNNYFRNIYPIRFDNKKRDTYSSDFYEKKHVVLTVTDPYFFVFINYYVKQAYHHIPELFQPQWYKTSSTWDVN